MQQDGFAYRFDWGRDGLQRLGPVSDVVIIVDILRFTSAVCAALESGAVVLPYPWQHDGLTAFAADHNAVAAGLREVGGPSLSPTDLLTLVRGTRLVLPSPNGSALAYAARDLEVPHVLAGSLRNATPTADRARLLASGGVISVIAAGEVCAPPVGVRAAVEDLLGAGAIIGALDPSSAVGAPRCSPEAAAAAAAFHHARPLLRTTLECCSSGRELLSRGWEDDVATCAALDVSNVVAVLVDGEFRAG